jgi:ribonuclease-3
LGTILPVLPQIRHSVYTVYLLLIIFLDKLFHYRVAISPSTNFQFKAHLQTTISANEKLYNFKGFSILSHRDLSKVPNIPVTRYHNDHRITLLPEDPPSNFCLEDLDMFSDFFFRDTLELYDWINGSGQTEAKMPKGKSQKFFYFMPRFERNHENGIEVLGMDHVMQYFINQDSPLMESKDLNNLLKCTEKDWEKYIDRFRGQLVTNPGKKPSTIRLDQVRNLGE